MRHAPRWCWVEDDCGIVVFTGSYADSLRHYKRNGGCKTGKHLCYTDRKDPEGKPTPRPIVGRKY